MTTQQYITNVLGGLNVSAATIETILAENSLTGTAVADIQACRMAIYNSFYLVWPTADIAEGDLHISYNAEAIKAFYRRLCDMLGLPDQMSGNPKVRGRSDVW